MVRILFLLFISSFLFLTPFHASAQEERAAPRSGEGISAFLQRNKRPGKAYYLEFLELNKKQLHGKQELRLGVKYLLPPLKSKTETAANSSTSSASAAGSGKTIHEPLFGKELAKVQVTGNRLKGACFYVVSGHGGPDPGAIGKIGNV